MENKEYQPRFVRVGDVGFDMEKLTNFVRSGNRVTVYFGPDDYLIFDGDDAVTLWNYLWDISQNLREVIE